MAETKQKPGSDEAVDNGCICPLPKSDKGLLGKFKKKDDGRWINVDCPVHGLPCCYCGKIGCKGDYLAYDCGE